MKINIFLLVFLISNVSLGQMQTEFYVDGIQDIKYLTLNFCVDNNGKTTNVKIVNDKTTVNDTLIINQILNYRKSIEYFPDTKLKNNCHDQIFSFINKEFENCKIFEDDFYKLENLKLGTFKYYNINYKNTVITRTKDFQIEETNGEVYKYKIEWFKPNYYVLTYLEVGKKEHEYLIGEKIFVEIIKQIDSDNYVYKSKLLDRSVITGIIMKVDN